MLGDLSGPMMLVVIAVVVLVVVGLITGIIVWSVKKSSRARTDELQRAYEAGLTDRNN